MLQPSCLLQAFSRTLGLGLADAVYADIRVSTFCAVNSSKGHWRYLAKLQQQAAAVPAAVKATGKARAVPRAQRRSPRQDAGAIAAVLRPLVTEIAGEESLTAAGVFAPGAFDSLSAVELVSKIDKALHTQLPSTLVFDYPSIPSMAEAIAEKLAADVSVPEDADAALEDAEAAEAEEIGFSTGPSADHDVPSSLLAHPPAGSSTSLHTLFGVVDTASRTPALLSCTTQAADSIGVVPWNRWDAETRTEHLSFFMQPPRFGGFLQEPLDAFDASSFGILRPEAELMDPQQRLLMELAAELLTATDGASSAAPSTSVHVGIQQMEYGSLSSAWRPLAATSATSTPFSVAAGRISFLWGLQGPAVSLDTACSSALVALDAALKSATAAALVGAVNLLLARQTSAAAAAAGMLTQDGRCKTLDARADGYVRAETASMMLLRPLEGAAHDLAEAHGQPSSYSAVVLATTVNQDGRSSSLTAPNGPAQQRVLRMALGEARLAPDALTGLEMHGTGTALGDPIEFGAAMAVLTSSRAAGAAKLRPIFSAAKSRAGHAEPAAGALGLLHAMDQLGAGHARPVPGLTSTNHHIAAQLQAGNGAGPYVGRQPAPAGRHRTQGTSAFAFQGTNAHVILGAARDDAETRLTLPTGLSAPKNPLPWQRQRHWFAPAPMQLLGAFQSTGSAGAARFEANLQASRQAWSLLDHRVAGRAILPAVAMAELLCAAQSSLLGELDASVAGMAIQAPLVLQDPPGERHGSFVNSIMPVLIVSHPGGDLGLASSKATVHASASVAFVTRSASLSAQAPRRSLQQKMFDAFVLLASRVLLPLVSLVSSTASPPGAPSIGGVESGRGSGLQPGGVALAAPAVLDAATHVLSGLAPHADAQITSRPAKDMLLLPVGVAMACRVLEAGDRSGWVSGRGSRIGDAGSSVAADVHVGTSKEAAAHLCGFSLQRRQGGSAAAGPKTAVPVKAADEQNSPPSAHPPAQYAAPREPAKPARPAASQAPVPSPSSRGPAEPPSASIVQATAAPAATPPLQPQPSLEQAVSSSIQTIVGRLLGGATAEDMPFSDAGLDSLGGSSRTGRLFGGLACSRRF